jgi:hypothetical protein
MTLVLQAAHLIVLLAGLLVTTLLIARFILQNSTSILL